MCKINFRRPVLICVICMMMVFGLTGCFRGNIAVDVKSDGSGIVTIALGLTQQAQALVANQGSNSFQSIEQSLSNSMGQTPSDVKVKKWSEGDYDWVSVTKNFSNLDQINQVLGSKGLFKSFSLIRNQGIFQDEFILNAELAALSSDIPSDQYSIDPTAFLDTSFSLRLPGKIAETNGFPDANDPNLIVWHAQGYKTVMMTARSLSWNWLNIFGITAAFFILVIFGIYALGGFDSILKRSKNKIAYLPPVQNSLPASAQLPSNKTNYIIDLGIEDLLNQVNTRALNSTGEMRKKQGEIALLWKDAHGMQKYVYIKDLGNQQISINGQNCPATIDNAKAGIMNVIHKQ